MTLWTERFFSFTVLETYFRLYGFTEESSAYEFVNCIANMDNMLSGIIPNDFDRYEEIVNPLKEHLKKIGVDVRENAVVYRY